ncbi:MAG: hypothetical protein O2973_00365 [Gemmatimonadetes bacterium]|nr:hypothetical protein [Gemmatimonadota bacterium]
MVNRSRPVTMRRSVIVPSSASYQLSIIDRTAWANLVAATGVPGRDVARVKHEFPDLRGRK